MIKNIMTKENLEVVGKAGYRIGKDIVREGTKAVAGKAVGAALAVAMKEGFSEIKNMDLNSVLGDITRIEKKKARKLKKEMKKLGKDEKDEIVNKAKDIRDKAIDKINEKSKEESEGK